MGSMVSLIRRAWRILNPAETAKSSGAIRFGLIGASGIAPMALIRPAKSHSEVIIASVAARDPKRAEAYAKKYKIGKVHKSYQELIDDPSIDAVYVALPICYHFEWAKRGLQAGKHVLLEKPSTSNAAETKFLIDFHRSLSSKPDSPCLILLEAFHNRFHPAWQSFLSSLSPSDIESVECEMNAPAGIFDKDDLRFKYSLSGGTLIEFGTYAVSALRQVFNSEPEECIYAESRLPPKDWDQECDEAFKGKWRFPNGGIGSLYADFKMRGALGVPTMGMPKVVVVHKETAVAHQEEDGNQTHTQKKTVKMSNFLAPHFWHNISIMNEHLIKNSEGKTVKRWVEKNDKKAYVWVKPSQDGQLLPGEDHWSTYRYMLEEFVNKVKGRPGSGVWVDGEESIKQSSMIDEAYLKAGLPLRPSREVN